MARTRRTLDRRTLRDQTDAAERQKPEDEAEETEDEEEDEDEEDEDEDAEAADTAEAAEPDEEADEDEEEEKPKPKKKKAPPKPKAPRPSRARTPKVVRMRMVWGVFNNSHQMVQEYEYPNKAGAEEAVAKLTADKKSGHPFFLQPVKKPSAKEEKDEKEKKK